MLEYGEKTITEEEADEVIREYYQLKNNSFKILTYILMNTYKYWGGMHTGDTIENLVAKLKISVNTFYLAKKDLMAKEWIRKSYYGDWEVDQKTIKLHMAMRLQLQKTFKEREK